MISLEKVLKLEHKGIDKEEYLKLISNKYSEGAFSNNAYKSKETYCHLLTFYYEDEYLEFYVETKNIGRTKLYVVKRFGNYQKMKSKKIISPIFLFQP